MPAQSLTKQSLEASNRGFKPKSAVKEVIAMKPSSSEGKADEPAFPWLAMSAICIGMLAHSVVFTAPMPFVAFMVVDFGMSPTLDSAGYWAGWITGTFMIGRALAGEMQSPF
jgi:hypothetical protein